MSLFMRVRSPCTGNIFFYTRTLLPHIISILLRGGKRKSGIVERKKNGQPMYKEDFKLENNYKRNCD